jgi:mRNA interferase RelE/StbE
MSPFTIRIKKSVEKDLTQLPRDLILSVLSTIESLGSDPFPRNFCKISGAEHFYRVRVGEYRIVYQVLVEEKVVTIFYIRHRSVAYRAF